MTNSEIITKMIEYFDVEEREEDRFYGIRLIQIATKYGNCDDMRHVIDRFNGRFFKSGPLAIACEQGDIEKVSVLLDEGATFLSTHGWFDCSDQDYWNDALSVSSEYHVIYHYLDTDWIKDRFGVEIREVEYPEVSVSTRVAIIKEIVDRNKEKSWDKFEYSKVLLRALTYGDTELVKACAEEGICIDAEAIAEANDLKYELCQRIGRLPRNRRAEVLSLICDCADHAETELIMTKDIFRCDNAFFCKDVLDVVLERCNLKRIKKEDIIHAVIDMNQTNLLSVLEKHRLFDQLTVRKKSKKYAEQNGKVRAQRWFEEAEDRISETKIKRRSKIKEKDEGNSFSEKCFSHRGSTLTGLTKQGFKYINDNGICSLRLPKTINGISITSISPKATADWEEVAPSIVELVIPGDYKIYEKNDYDFEFFPVADSVKRLIFENGDRITNVFINPCIEDVEILGGEKYTSRDGVVFSKDMTKLFYCPTSKPDKEYAVPDTVNIIQKDALSRCRFDKLIIPDSVELIEERGVWDNSIRSVYIGSGVRYIGNEAFASCENTKELILNEGLEEIGSNAFSYCSADEIVIPSTVKIIEEKAFFESDAQFIFKDDDLIIMPGAFAGCNLDMSAYSDRLKGKMNRCGLSIYGDTDVFKGKTRDEYVAEIESLLPEIQITEEMTLFDIRRLIERKEIYDQRTELLSKEKDPFDFDRNNKISQLIFATLEFDDIATFKKIIELKYIPEGPLLVKIVEKGRKWIDVLIENGFHIDEPN